LRDTIAHIGEDFWRLRLGIGHPGNKADVIDYVLTRAPRVEEDLMLEAVNSARTRYRCYSNKARNAP